MTYMFLCCLLAASCRNGINVFPWNCNNFAFWQNFKCCMCTFFLRADPMTYMFLCWVGILLQKWHKRSSVELQWLHFLTELQVLHVYVLSPSRSQRLQPHERRICWGSTLSAPEDYACLSHVGSNRCVDPVGRNSVAVQHYPFIARGGFP